LFNHNNQTSKMADEFMKPDVCVCSDELINALADYGRKSLSLREALKYMRVLLLTLFGNRSQMVNSRDEILFHLRLSLTEEEQEVFRVTDKYFRKKGKTDEEKALVVYRQKSGKKLARVFLELLNGVFPPDDDENPFKSPSPAATPITSPATNDNVSETKTAGLSLDGAFAEASLTTPTIADMPVPSAQEQEQDEDEEEHADEEADEEQEQVRPSRSLPKAQVVSVPMEMLRVMGDIPDTFVSLGWKVGVCGRGHDNIIDVWVNRGVNVEVFEADGPLPNVDIVLTRDMDVLAMCIPADKQCIILIPVETMSTPRFHGIVGHTKYDIFWPIGRSVMIHDGKSKCVDTMVWLIFHADAKGCITFNPIGDVGDVEIGSQDSEGKRGYDTDEEEARVRDQAIEENATEWHDGYHGDGGFIVGNTVEDGVPGMADLGADGERVLLPGQTIIRVRKPKQPKK
jgi:hypothetical protein